MVKENCKYYAAKCGGMCHFMNRCCDEVSACPYKHNGRGIRTSGVQSLVVKAKLELACTTVAADDTSLA